MEPSKLPKDILELGRHLARELGFEDGVDTLGRWMAHHLADLIDIAENGTTLDERLRAQANATETILKIWEHRTSLPGKGYPLAPYKDILLVLDRLRPSDNPFRYFGHHTEAKREQLAAALFDDLSRLIIALLLMQAPSVVDIAEQETIATEALSETEQYLLHSLHQWSELFTATSKDSGRTQKGRNSHKQAEINLNEIAIEIVDDITTTLTELRSELEKSSNST